MNAAPGNAPAAAGAPATAGAPAARAAGGVRSRRRRVRRAGLWVALAAGLALAVVGCTSTVTPPADVRDGATVFLLREAMHTGIVLPPAAPGDQYVEFGYGDWSWFALGNERWYHAFATVLWPTRGALGRRTFGARTADELVAAVRWAELAPLVVERARAEALRVELQRAFDARIAEAAPRPDLGWVFVPDDRGYWFANTCADVAARWFEALGCTVGWVPIRTSLAVAK
jgi:hypothetical protein